MLGAGLSVVVVGGILFGIVLTLIVRLRAKRVQRASPVGGDVLTADELEDVRVLAHDLQQVVSLLSLELRPDIATAALNARAKVLLAEANMVAAMEGYNGFPAAIAVSINDEVVHGIPSDQKLIKEGDLVTIQVSAQRKGLHAAIGWTFGVGQVALEKSRLLEVGKRALKAAESVVSDQGRTGDVGHAIQQTVEEAGYHVIRDFVGYGMGRRLITEPQIACVGTPGRGPRFRAGQVLHLHVILAEGGWDLEILEGEWTAVTLGRSPSALFTAMVAVEAGGCRRLTFEPTG